MALTYTKKKTYTRKTPMRTRKPPRYGTKYTKKKTITPSRYRGGSKQQLMQTKYVTKALSQVAETFYNPLAQVNDVAINTVTSGSTQVCFKGMTLGQTVPSHLSGYTAIGGMDFSTAVGKYCYLKRGQALMTLETDPNESNDSLMYTRMIVFKNKKATTPAGSIYSPNTQLFLQNDGTHLGQNSTAFDGKIAMNAPLNRQNFIIYRDEKATLSHLKSAYSAKFPCMKKYYINMPFYKKAALDSSFLPTDVDYHYNILLLVTNQGNEGTPNDLLISLNNHLVTWTDM